jgi:5-methylcytosine-specific restriction protein A
MSYTVNVADIEAALLRLNGEARAKQIQDDILVFHCKGVVPSNYQHERSFRQTIQRKIEDYCPQAEGFDGSRKEAKFLRVGPGLYRMAIGHGSKEFPAIEEVPDETRFIEGATKKIFVNSYERSPEARKKCISHYGPTCVVCGFDFEKTYGEIGRAFTHVHHLIPLSNLEGPYVVDPIKDLRPVCANCHAMIHRTVPALTVEQVHKAVTDQRKP